MFGRVSTIPSELRGVIANLFQPHQVRQDDPAPLDAVNLVDLLGQFFDRLLIQSSLLFAQSAKGIDFCFLRQIGDDVFVSLEPPQDIGLHEPA